MKMRKTGFSLIEMIIALLIYSAILVVVFQVFVSVNSILHNAYYNMRDFNDIKRGTSALWSLDDSGTPTDFTNLTRYQREQDLVQKLRDAGISENIIDIVFDNLELWYLMPSRSDKTYLAVKPLASWR